MACSPHLHVFGLALTHRHKNRSKLHTRHFSTKRTLILKVIQFQPLITLVFCKELMCLSIGLCEPGAVVSGWQTVQRWVRTFLLFCCFYVLFNVKSSTQMLLIGKIDVFITVVSFTETLSTKNRFTLCSTRAIKHHKSSTYFT